MIIKYLDPWGLGFRVCRAQGFFMGMVVCVCISLFVCACVTELRIGQED